MNPKILYGQLIGNNCFLQKLAKNKEKKLLPMSCPQSIFGFIIEAGELGQRKKTYRI